MIVFPAKIKKEKSYLSKFSLSHVMFFQKKGKEKKNAAPKNGELPDGQRPFMTRATRTTTGKANNRTASPPSVLVTYPHGVISYHLMVSHGPTLTH